MSAETITLLRCDAEGCKFSGSIRNEKKPFFKLNDKVWVERDGSVELMVVIGVGIDGEKAICSYNSYPSHPIIITKDEVVGFQKH